MGKTIAVTGKGGAGKTTVAALMVRLLVEAKRTPVLAVDADPNLNLNAALGVAVGETVGDVREDGLQRAADLPGGMAKSEFLTMKVQQALVEASGFDLLAMGRPEGPGCYCFANSILRACIDQIAKQYASVVIDCEAGLEHMSRRTAGNVDVLLILSDPSVRGVDTAARVMGLVNELQTTVGKTVFAFTRVAGEIPDDLVSAASQRGLPQPHLIPEDPQVGDLDIRGKPLVGVSETSAALRAAKEILEATSLTSD